MSHTCKTLDYQIDGQIYSGFLALPATTPKALILVAHAWAGQTGFEQDKAKWLADHGYAGFALDVYGKGKRGETTEACQALMEPLASNRAELQNRLARGLEVAMAETGLSRAAAIGFCFGGLSVLDMARKNMKVEGVVSFHGLLGTAGDTADRIEPKVLALHGWNDPMAMPEDVLAFASEMETAQADWQLHAYGRTLHAFTNPEANNPDFGTVFSPAANRRSFAACLDFLNELFGSA